MKSVLALLVLTLGSSALADDYVSQLDIGVSPSGTWHVGHAASDIGFVRANLTAQLNFPSTFPVSLFTLEPESTCLSQVQDGETDNGPVYRCVQFGTVYALRYRQTCHGEFGHESCTPPRPWLGQASGTGETPLAKKSLVQTSGGMQPGFEGMFTPNEFPSENRWPATLTMETSGEYGFDRLKFMSYGAALDGNAYAEAALTIAAKVTYRFVPARNEYEFVSADFSDSHSSFVVSYVHRPASDVSCPNGVCSDNFSFDFRSKLDVFKK